MSEKNTQKPISYKETPYITQDLYEKMYTESISNPEQFWGDHATKYLHWYKTWNTVYQGDFSSGEVSWFEGGILNASYNCIDRHTEQGNGEKTAIIWVSNEPGEERIITYNDLLDEVSRLANVLKEKGVRKGDRVCIYMPMIPEATFAMLACARIGAIHTVVFGGFSHEALATRIQASEAKVVVTADVGKRGAKIIPLKSQVAIAIETCPSVEAVLVVTTDESQTLPQIAGEISYHEAVQQTSPVCEPAHMNAEDPLFILYTSGSTGQPKGVVHTTAGYLLYTSVSHKYVFDYKEHDVYWCTADVGWITGHSFVVYGPLVNGATIVLYEGIPTYPDCSRYWNIIDTYGVTIFYSTPTAIRLLMAQGDSFISGTSRESLKILGTAGEPINPEAWQWYYETIGNSVCPIMDTWWQTEIAGPAITPLPFASHLKPGAVSKPFFGIQPVLLDDDGKEIIGAGSGMLAIKGSWPSQLRGLYNNKERFLETYFKAFPGYYISGDGAQRDEDGDLWVTGRIDDMMEISGHLIGTAEIESAITKHSDVAEAAVISIPHNIKGESIRAFVVPIAGTKETDAFADEIITLVKETVGSFAKPDELIFVPDLPKTRSGKIMRRILRHLAQGDTKNFGDISTLADPGAISAIITKMNL